ncbi:hypothetical protein H6G33_36330 [Calothrix sp. FACHB-1219]|uniref:hypothetical protein n=1 Tax=unclassified Calothrix TaxID=2619626 RepID=UPI0016859F7D|nr:MULTISPECIES: hypothetical protein [unclassified Calothrix]MBD2207780.1 hypothetical protein [Calothrix sp. FACHB-168]MBD2222400.1 hypothetical protein [Calothrix sp. FACHB-1219]
MKKQANFKLPEELITALQDRAAAERTSATDLVIQALNSFLGNPEEGSSIGNTSIGNNIYDIADCVEGLKARLDKLEANKNFYFMYNSPSCEANDIDIRIESDSIIPNSEEVLSLESKVEELEAQNKNLLDRVSALEALMQEYRYQSLPHSIERDFKS